jgi:alpha-D-ribose 1-methylphosphonate 5-triphosphate synthase subunit PhnH
MALNIHKAKIISFTHKTNSVHFNCCVSDVLIFLTDYVNDVMLGSKLHFHCHVSYVYSQAGLTHFITCNVSSLDSLIVL